MMMFSRCSTTLQVINTSQKIHLPLIKGIASALFSIFSEGKYADKVVPAVLKANPQWGSRDRRFVAENTYEIVRYWRYYWFLLNQNESLEEEDLLRLVGARLLSMGLKLPDLAAFNSLTLNTQEPDHRIKASYPDWLYDRCEKQLGRNWQKEADSLNEKANVFLRVNTSKISPLKALNELLKNSIPSTLHPTIPGCIQLEGRVNLEQVELIKKGLLEIQDAGSQLIAPYLQPREATFIVDACAGAGGKTMHLSDQTKDQARIIAMDTEAWKLDNLLFRAKRSGFTSITIQTLPFEQFFQKNALKVDSLLLDVPCSGTGVLKRNPDSKWKLSAGRIEELKSIQADILDHYTVLVKPGGSLVYATCSILTEENEEQVSAFLKKHQDFELIHDHHQWPSMGTDGFYMALIKRK